MSALSALSSPTSALPASPSLLIDLSVAVGPVSTVLDATYTCYSKVLPSGWYLFSIPGINMTLSAGATIATYNCTVATAGVGGAIYLQHETAAAGDSNTSIQDSLSGLVFSDGVLATQISVRITASAAAGTTTIPVFAINRLAVL